MTAGVSWSDLASYLTILGNAGVAGVWVFAWLKRWIVSHHELERADSERDQWHHLYMEEREAHERTRDALRIASERGEASAEALQFVANVMNTLRAQGIRDEISEAHDAQRGAKRGAGEGQGAHQQIAPPGRRRRTARDPGAPL